jgi:hypothetical protein
VRTAIPTDAAAFLQFIKAKQLDFQVAINEYEDARKKSENKAYVQWRRQKRTLSTKTLPGLKKRERTWTTW